MTLKILHVADLHLDTAFTGIAKNDYDLQKRLVQAPFDAFERCVSMAVNQNIDCMVIAGDIYDANKQTIAARYFLNKQFERLAQANIPVVLSFGNHDYYVEQIVHHQFPSNVFYFKDETVRYFDIQTRTQETLRIYGFSYTKRWVEAVKIDEYPVNPQATDYTIGLLHGDLATATDKVNHYAPFTTQALLAKDYDYWALGHIHQAMPLNEAPLIQYSGTIQGRHINEQGDKGAYIVELEHNKPTKSTFISLAPIIWTTATIQCHSQMTAQTLVEELKLITANYIDESNATSQSYLIAVNLEQSERLNLQLRQEIEENQLDDLLVSEWNGELFAKIITVRLKTTSEIKTFEYDPMLNESFKAAQKDLIEGTLFEESMKDLRQHPVIRRWLKEQATNEQLKEIVIEQVNQQLLTHFAIELGEDNHEN